MSAASMGGSGFPINGLCLESAFALYGVGGSIVVERVASEAGWMRVE